MPLEIKLVDERNKDMAMWKNNTGQRIYVDSTKTNVVDGDSPDAAFVLVGPEGSLPMEEAKKYGLATDSDAQKEPTNDAEANSESDAKSVGSKDSGVQDKSVKPDGTNKASR